MLNSVLNQRYKNLDIHVVDNASMDETLAIVSRFSDPRIKIHSHSTNIGAEENFNRCIELATGKYTAIFHADDIYEPEIVADQVNLLEAQPLMGAALTEARLINEMGIFIGAATIPKKYADDSKFAIFDFPCLLKAIIRYNNFLACPSAMLRTEIYRREIVRWRGDMFGSSSDLDIWFRVAEHHKIGVLRAPLMRYRISAAQVSHTMIRARTNRADLFRVLDFYLKKYDLLGVLTPLDLRRYGWLERADRVIRAMNFFLIGEIIQAGKLTRGVFSLDAWLAALLTRRGFKTLLLGGFIRLTLFFGMAKPSRFILMKIKEDIR